MQYRLRNNGFSLTEVLMAAGILTIGFAFIAGMFPVGVKLTALTTEQTIAPIVVDEAIAKIKLYGIDPNILPYDSYRLFNKDILPNDVLTSLYTAGYSFDDVDDLLEDESLYPSTDTPLELRRYNWSALCRRLGVCEVHVIVFVSRKAGAGARYLTHKDVYGQADYGQANPSMLSDWPVPVKMVAEIRNNKQKLLIDAGSDERSYISTGGTIVDDATGRVYRVLKRRLDDDNVVIVLDRKWEWKQPVVLPANVSVWVVPPAVGSGRNPCVRVDPTHTIRF